MNALTLYPALNTSSNPLSISWRGTPRLTCCDTSYHGSMSRVSSITMPRAPSATTEPQNASASSRRNSTRSPSATTNFIAATESANTGCASPEPWVAVAHAPAIEMSGIDAIFDSAKPASDSSSASSVYRMPDATVTVERVGSMLSLLGRPSKSSKSPGVSAMALNEWPHPRAAHLSRRHGQSGGGGQPNLACVLVRHQRRRSRPSWCRVRGRSSARQDCCRNRYLSKLARGFRFLGALARGPRRS